MHNSMICCTHTHHRVSQRGRVTGRRREVKGRRSNNQNKKPGGRRRGRGEEGGEKGRGFATAAM